jgi:hypothetical protein
MDITSSAAAPFIIEPVPLGEDNLPGAVSGLVPHRSYRWLIAEIAKINAFSATISGFAANKFVIDPSAFESAYPGLRGQFWLDMDSNGIYLNSTLVPEPVSGSFTVVVFGTILLLRRRQRILCL